MKTNPIILIALCLISSVFVKLQAQDPAKKSSHTEIVIKEIPAQKTLVIHADVPASQIGQKIGEMYGELFAFMQTQKITPAGPVFALYYSWDPNGNTVFEAGIPVSEEVSGNDHIQFKEFQAMKAVSTLFTGAYEDFGSVYTEIDNYIKENKIEAAGQSWEVYLTDPSSIKDQSQNQTIIYFPIK
jgi:effector-binding domain-containing protein